MESYDQVLGQLVEQGLLNLKIETVLMIGLTRHWGNFYLEVIKAQKVCAVELDCAIELDWDILVEQKFDVIHALGIFYRLPDEEVFERALKKLALLLTPQGLLVANDRYESSRTQPQYRSLNRWREAATQAGLILRRMQSARVKGEAQLPPLRLGFWGRVLR